jgi:cation diffusion facilitator family transporter
MNRPNQSAKPLIKDTKVVGTSFFVSISDVLINAVVAAITGSVVMLSQALQGLSDLLTTGLLYRGVKVSKRKRDDKHHFGYGRELFFWVIIAGVFMFFGTGMLSVYFGLQQILNPQPLEEISIALVVLVVSLIANSYAFSLSVKRLKRSAPSSSWVRHIRSSSMIETKSTFLVDFLGTLAAIVGLIAISSFIITGNSQFDGLGGLTIGILMMIGSVLIIADVKGLIVGRAVSRETAQKINVAALSVQHVERILDLRTTFIGSAKLLVIIEVHLDDRLTTDEIEVISDEIKSVIRRDVPQASIVQVEVETPDEELSES